MTTPKTVAACPSLASSDGCTFSTAEWMRFADHCKHAARASERMAAEAKTDIERDRWLSHAANFRATAEKTVEILNKHCALSIRYNVPDKRRGEETTDGK